MPVIATARLPLHLQVSLEPPYYSLVTSNFAPYKNKVYLCYLKPIPLY